MAISPESLSDFSQTPATAESLVMVQFDNIEPEYRTEYQPARRRSVVLDPDLKLVGVQFWKHFKHVQRVDLRDLVLGDTGVDQEDLVEMIEGIGVEVTRQQPRYEAQEANEAQALQEVDITHPGHILRGQGHIPKKGEMQPKRPEMQVHRSRRRG